MNGKTAVLIGTSGYSYDDWRGVFYPPEIAKNDFLGYYATQFPAVEVNYSYYRQPHPDTSERMVKKTPDNFLFAVKAHRSLTHEVSDRLDNDVEEFKTGIEPFVEASRLGAVLFQYPYSFHYTPQSRTHLARVLAAFDGLPRAVEFRNREWQRDSVTAGLRRMEVSQVSVDEPALPNLPIPQVTATADFAYVRFHGRNSENWWTGDNVSRYDYRYEDSELLEWIPRFKQFLAHCKKVFVFFNNHSRAQAVTNAKMMNDLMERNL